MPRIDYVSQTVQSVSVSYVDMPPATEVVFVNTTTGAVTPSLSTALSNGGDGSADIPIDANMTAGQYSLLAQSQATKQYIAQTIGFSIN